MPSLERPLQRFDLFRYGLIAFPMAFAGLPVYVHAPAFYATEMGISLTIIGGILLFVRAFDAVQDPWIGSFIDRHQRHRKILLVIGMALMGFGFWLVFNPFITSPVASFAGGIIVCTTGLSVVSINVQALGGLWQTDGPGRTRITSWREALGLLGLLCASLAPFIFGGGDARAFYLISLFYLPLLALCGVIFLSWLARVQIAVVKTCVRTSFTRLYHRWHITFCAIYLSNACASAIPAVLVIFFIQDRLDAASMTGLFLFIYFIGGAAGMPLWQMLARRVGKLQAWLVSMILAVLSFVWAFTLSSGDMTAYAVVCLVSGLALGGDLALPPSIIADHIDRRGDQVLAARYFSIMTFFNKAALALAAGLMLPALGMLGYHPGKAGGALYLGYSYALVPSLMKAASAFALWRFISSFNSGGYDDETQGDAFGGRMPRQRLHQSP
ncbi:MAG: MFS transporter [Pseudomonadota bacterium]